MSTLPDLYTLVTKRILDALEAGTAPWQCPWRGGGVDARPANATTGRAYRGINVLLLNLQALTCGYSSGRWLTYQQARAAGGYVRQGEQGTPVVFFKMHAFDKNSHPDSDGAADRRLVPLLRAFTVFSVEQCVDLPPCLAPESLEPGSWDPVEAADHILSESGATVQHGGSKAFYAPGPDLIQLPPLAAFDCAGDYYATALHELTHWTGHASRCNRPLGVRHGIDAYAFEELVAEMGSAFLTDHCGLIGRVEHASYIASWLQALRNDKRLIFTAASQAQRAADYLLAVDQIEPAAQAQADALAA